MKISVFLSYPRPFRTEQKRFIDEISAYLVSRGYEPRTLGVTDFDLDTLLNSIHHMLAECNGILVVAFRRTFLEEAVVRPNSDLGIKGSKMNEKWLTSPWTQIETSMAYQMGLPILIFRESGVIEEGVMDVAAMGVDSILFNLDHYCEESLEAKAWGKHMATWEEYVCEAAAKRKQKV